VSRLTGLAPDPRRPGYRLVEVDRGRFASLPDSELAGLGLEVGADIAGERLADLQRLADIEGALRAGMRALAFRSYASADLRRRLLQRQHPPRAVDAALARLTERELLNDARFAREYASVRARRGRGPQRLISDLLARGIPRGTAEASVHLALEEEGLDPARLARTVAERRAAQLAGTPVPVRKRRLLSFLKRRGFDGQLARNLVEELCLYI
jgi:regulatory protein